MRASCVRKALNHMSKASLLLSSSNDSTAKYFGLEIKEFREKIEKYLAEEEEEAEGNKND